MATDPEILKEIEAELVEVRALIELVKANRNITARERTITLRRLQMDLADLLTQWQEEIGFYLPKQMEMPNWEKKAHQEYADKQEPH